MTQAKLRTTELPSGDAVPVLGQGTWHLAEDLARRSEEIAALRTGLDLGMTLIDTAEMYADGGAEELVGEAIAGRRDEVFLVSKVLPQHATREGTLAACARSLARLGTEWIDLYLLHWRGPVPLEETLEGFVDLRRSGMIRHWGVSNFDVDDLNEVIALDGGDMLGTDQVLYNLTRRGIEYDLIPWCEKHGLPIMAYSPIEQGRALQHPTVRGIAKRHHAAPAQVALAWVLRRDGIIAIPKAGSSDHVRENRQALDLHLSARDMSELDLAFPPPTRKVPLEMI
jgi:diketogulonate reductase-like aldo/keto reductase